MYTIKHMSLYIFCIFCGVMVFLMIVTQGNWGNIERFIPMVIGIWFIAVLITIIPYFIILHFFERKEYSSILTHMIFGALLSSPLSCLFILIEETRNIGLVILGTSAVMGVFYAFLYNKFLLRNVNHFKIK